MSDNMIVSLRMMDLMLESVDVKITNKDKEVTRAKVSMYICFNTEGSNARLKNTFAPEWGNFFDIREGSVSYHAGEQEFLEDGRWARKGRQVCKVSKLLHYLVSKVEVCIYPSVEDELVKSKIIYRFVELLTTEISCAKSNVEILVSDDPNEIYSKETAKNGTGTLGNSCMRPESSYYCHNHSRFYNEIGAHIAYTVTPFGKLTARALLWKGCKTREGNTFNYMDRIYGTEEATVNFKEWAHENGFAHKVEQSMSNTELMMPDGSSIRHFNYISEAEWYDGFPYMDTLAHLSINENTFILDTDNGDLSMTETDGGNNSESDEDYDSESDEDYDRSNCEECGCSIPNEDLHEINNYYYCDDCCSYSEYHDHYVINSDSVYSAYHDSRINDDESVQTEDGDFFHKNDIDELIVEINNKYYNMCSNDVKQCEYCDDWHLAEDVHYYEQLNQDICDDCVDEAMEANNYVSIDGEWYAKDNDEVHLIEGTFYHENSNDIIQCEHCDEWFLVKDVTHYHEIYKNVCEKCLVDAMAEENYILKEDIWVKVEEIVEVEEVA